MTETPVTPVICSTSSCFFALRIMYSMRATSRRSMAVACDGKRRQLHNKPHTCRRSHMYVGAVHGNDGEWRQQHCREPAAAAARWGSYDDHYAVPIRERSESVSRVSATTLHIDSVIG